MGERVQNTKQARESRLMKKKAAKYRQTIMLFVSVGLLLLLCSSAFVIGTKLGMESSGVPSQVILVNDEATWLEEIIIEGESENEEPGIILVNRDNPLPTDYEVTLLTLPDGVNRAAMEAYEPLCNMLAAGREEGLSFEICSSYRDVERQKELFIEDVEQLILEGYSRGEAYEEVAKETMLPGCSEHATGLAFDIVALHYQMLDAGQEKTAENIWLQAHCAEYGFILRYPKGKEETTSINYESWHFRYVGVEAAKYIMENGITLEEYLEKGEMQ